MNFVSFTALHLLKKTFFLNFTDEFRNFICFFLVAWITDDDIRLKAAYWANIVTYRIFTRALGAIGE